MFGDTELNIHQLVVSTGELAGVDGGEGRGKDFVLNKIKGCVHWKPSRWNVPRHLIAIRQCSRVVIENGFGMENEDLLCPKTSPFLF